jgi:RNA polymerase sigma-70 factor (ECF subfamily)
MLDNEQELIKRAKKGESECFGRLYDHYLPQIYRYVLLKVTNRQEAEDLTHEVFLSAWQNLRGYRHRGFPFSSWLYNIARNRVIDFYRTRKIHTSLDNLDENLVKTVSAVAQEVDFSLDWEKIKAALKYLTEEQRDVVVMRFVEDLSHQEIAAALNKSEGAVRLIQHRAIQSLKNILGDYGGQNN